MVASCALACNSNARRYRMGLDSREWASRNADSAATSAHMSESASVSIMLCTFHDFCARQTHYVATAGFGAQRCVCMQAARWGATSIPLQLQLD